MSLQDPTAKMSKSDSNENAYILLMDDADTVRRKLKRAVTDSEGIVRYSDSQPGVKNLINIYSKITKEATDEIVASYEGKGYAELILTQELARLKAKKENNNDGFSTMRDIDKEPEAKKPTNSYQKRKAKELAIKFGVTDLDTVTDAMGLETKGKK